MSRKDTHAARSHRSKRAWKPKCKSILDARRKQRRKARQLTDNLGGHMISEIFGHMRRGIWQGWWR